MNKYYALDKRTGLFILMLNCIIASASLYAITSNTLLLENTASLSGALLCSIFLLFTYIKTNNFKRCWLFLSLVGTFVFLADARWIYVAAQGLSAPDDIFVGLLYTGANISFTLSVVQYFLYRKNNWNSAQLMIDLTSLSIIMMTLMWLLFLRDSVNLFTQFVDLWPYISYIAVLANFLTLTVLFGIYFSSSLSKFPTPYRFVIAGIMIYVVSDLTYTYQSTAQIYSVGNFIDFLYTFSLLMLITAGVIELWNPAKGSQAALQATTSPVDLSKRIKILYVAPLLIIVARGFNFFEVVFIAAVISIRHFLTTYIKSLKQQSLLDAEKAVTLQLESLVKARTTELEKSKLDFERLSKVDPLTALYNRRYFFEVLSALLESSAHESKKITIFMLDLDHFKEINDTHGHDIGDLVLIEISKRLASLQTEDFLLARMGGDEFNIAVSGLNTLEAVENTANRIISLCQSAIVIEPFEFNIGVSIGISHYPEDSPFMVELLRYADIAMYHAKSQGRGHFQYYNSHIAHKMMRKNNVLMALKTVQMDQEFSLHVQPQFKIPERQLVGAEVLLRWNSPTLGFVSPAEFIPLAEENGTIVQIGKWVLDKTISQLDYWLHKYHINLRIGINLSPIQLNASGFIAHLENRLFETGVDPRFIDLEITETSTMQTDVKMEEILTVLSGIGCAISIDDFGTGYSSLSYIKRFDIDRIKIAKELIDEIVSDKNSEMIVHAIVLMSQGLGLQTIAEGVETQAQLDLLEKLGCNEIQGYYFSKPLPLDVFEKTYLR